MKFSRRRDFVQYIAERAVLRSKPLILLDVGCRGGVHRIWREHGEHLRAYGFDPAEGEAERCTADETHPGITYYPWSIGTADGAVSLDAFVEREGLPHVDFIKIDTDGFDLDVLRSAEGTFLNGGVIGLLVEVPFFGTADPDSNTFHNIDRLLKSHGFQILDIDPFGYARPALPLPYDRDKQDTSINAAPGWADIFFLRTPSDPYSIIKAACFCSMFRSADVAAELLTDNRNTLDALIDVEACLDLLVPRIDGRAYSYREYMRRCGEDPDWLRPRRRGFPGGLDQERMVDLITDGRGSAEPIKRIRRRGWIRN